MNTHISIFLYIETIYVYIDLLICIPIEITIYSYIYIYIYIWTHPLIYISRVLQWCERCYKNYAEGGLGRSRFYHMFTARANAALTLRSYSTWPTVLNYIAVNSTQIVANLARRDIVYSSPWWWSSQHTYEPNAVSISPVLVHKSLLRY